MKKIININFQGSVIPIEESAYDILKQYVESLRRYFSNEEGRDEIINDIESRIAELFSERLKRGSACITEEDVNAVIASIGRPEDFEEQDMKSGSSSSYQQNTQQQQQSQSNTTYATTAPRGRLYRNADDKILGGVCSGLANYLGIDPVIMRIVFVLLIGALFWVYILLWIIVPSQSLQTNITKRLYRNPDDKVFAGVCGGLASYFNIDAWIPRLIFALPLIIGLVSGTLNAIWWNWDFGVTPRIVTGSLGSTLFVTYIILWIAVPYAYTASEKLEMRGEKVDLNSIRDTVKQSAQQFGERAKEFGQTASAKAKSFSTEAAPAMRRVGRGAGHAIGVIFKAFFIFIAGSIAVALFAVLIFLVFGSMATFPLKNFILEGSWQNVLAWCSLLFFLGIPLIALITWLVRRIMGVRSTNHYLGYVFGTLWTIGLICFIILLGSLGRNFKAREWIEDPVTITQPTNKLVVDVIPTHLEFYHGDEWFGFNRDHEIPIYGNNMDTLLLNTVRIRIVKSKDSAFHVTKMRISRGFNQSQARATADEISFDVEQKDSTLLLPAGFPISNKSKFRNQQVLILIEMPIGKQIRMKRRVNRYDWFNIDIDNRRVWNSHWDDNWEDACSWDTEEDYVMTPDCLQNIKDLDPTELKKGNYKVIKRHRNGDDNDSNVDGDNNDDNNGADINNDKKNSSNYKYRYKQLADSIAKSKLREELKIKDSLNREKKLKEAEKSSTSNSGGNGSKQEMKEEALTGGHILTHLLVFAK